MARKPRVEFEITAEDKSAAALRQAEATLKNVAGNVGSFAVAAAGALTGLGVAVGKIGQQLDTLAKTAKTAGVGVEVFQAWQYAATQSGASAEEFASAMTRANTAIGQVANGSGPALDLFNRLGIAVRDVNGNVRSTESVIRDFAESVSGMKSPAEQAAASAALFGRAAGPSMALLLREGTAGLKEFEDRARELGLVISEEATVNADAFMDKMDELRSILNAQLANAIFENAEALEALATAFGTVVGAAAGGAGTITRFVQWIGEELAARIHGVALNDIPRLTGALQDAQEELQRLKDGGGMVNLAGETVQTQIKNATAEVDRLTAALARAREMERNGLGFTRPGDARQEPPKLDVPEAAPVGLTDGQLEEIARREKQAGDLRIRAAKEFNAAIVAERDLMDQEEQRIWEEKLARAAGYATIEAQEAAAREQELWAAKMEARAIQWEEELALELGFKSARDMALQQAEEAHQDALLKVRTRQFGQYQQMAIALAKFEKATAKEKTATALSYAQQLTAGLAQNSKTMFNINKAVSIAEAVINTATGVTAALRLGPQGIPLAALIAAQGAVQIATISSTQFGGASSGFTGGGPGSGIPSMANSMFEAPTVSAQERNAGTIRIELVGGNDSEIARAMIKSARVVLDEEDDMLASRRSRQALEFAS